MFDATAIRSLYDKLVSLALATGVFDSVDQHEPKSSPGNRITASLWVQSIAPDSRYSGLAETAGIVIFTFRIYQNWLSKPEDAIDPAIMAATSKMIEVISGDFSLGSTVVAVDLLGMAGTPLSARAGYVDISKVMHRVMDITIPVIIDNMWTQAG